MCVVEVHNSNLSTRESKARGFQVLLVTWQDCLRMRRREAENKIRDELVQASAWSIHLQFLTNLSCSCSRALSRYYFESQTLFLLLCAYMHIYVSQIKNFLET